MLSNFIKLIFTTFISTNMNRHNVQTCMLISSSQDLIRLYKQLSHLNLYFSTSPIFPTYSDMFFQILIFSVEPPSLPSPLPATKARSFLYSRRIAEDVFRLLASQDEKLVSQLAHSLSQVSNEDMWVFMCCSMSDNFIHCICGCPTAVYMQMV